MAAGGIKPGVIGGGVISSPGEGKSPGVLGGGFGGVGKRLGRSRMDGSDSSAGELQQELMFCQAYWQHLAKEVDLGGLLELRLATLKAYSVVLAEVRPLLLLSHPSPRQTSLQPPLKHLTLLPSLADGVRG